MSLEYRLRDRRHPPFRILGEVGVRQGMTVIDFGCGPGGFSLAAAQLVGPAGRVYALDIHPMAIKSVNSAVLRGSIGNVVPVLGNDYPELSQGSIDMILLFDVLHHLSEPQPLLERFHRLLKPNGVLSVRDHRLPEAQLLETVNESGLFRVVVSNAPKSIFLFEKT
jgi:2-polyprenyl-3-methyl-5-hydroxy-6-metoxy-1,4-benzoquinol methylase